MQLKGLLLILLSVITLCHAVANATLTPVLQVLIFLQENLKANPETLGDPRKESPEELAERHERVVAASLLALSSLLDLLVSKQQHDNVTGML